MDQQPDFSQKKVVPENKRTENEIAENRSKLESEVRGIVMYSWGRVREKLENNFELAINKEGYSTVSASKQNDHRKRYESLLLQGEDLEREMVSQGNNLAEKVQERQQGLRRSSRFSDQHASSLQSAFEQLADGLDETLRPRLAEALNNAQGMNPWDFHQRLKDILVNDETPGPLVKDHRDLIEEIEHETALAIIFNDIVSIKRDYPMAKYAGMHLEKYYYQPLQGFKPWFDRQSSQLKDREGGADVLAKCKEYFNGITYKSKDLGRKERSRLERMTPEERTGLRMGTVAVLSPITEYIEVIKSRIALVYSMFACVKTSDPHSYGSVKPSLVKFKQAIQYFESKEEELQNQKVLSNNERLDLWNDIAGLFYHAQNALQTAENEPNLQVMEKCCFNIQKMAKKAAEGLNDREAIERFTDPLPGSVPMVIDQ